MKLCSRKTDFITIRLNDSVKEQTQVRKVSMPIGMVTECDIYPTCGLSSKSGYIGNEDKKECFYVPERSEAQILWSSGGYVEYAFPNNLTREEKITKISFSLEICSEAPNYREDWKSNLTVWINGVECGTWTSPDDFGERRELLTPAWVSNDHRNMENLRHGLLKNQAVMSMSKRRMGQI